MPLINLQTNLKSLKYGHDGPNGGSSSQPYIQTDINNPISPSLNLLLRNPLLKDFLNGVSDVGEFLNVGGFNVDEAIRRAGIAIDQFGKIDDGFVRGGAIGATNAAITDTIRIAKFFTDTPKGPLFLARQAAMQLTNPKLEVKRIEFSGQGFRSLLRDVIRGDVNNLVGTFTGGLLEPTRIYNLGINTIAQVPVNYLGGHIIRHGLLPLQNEDSKYESVVKFNNQQTSNTNNADWRLTGNRLVKLAKKFELGDGEGNAVGVSELLRRLRRDTRRTNRRGRRDARRQTRATRRANRLTTANTAAAEELAFGEDGVFGAMEVFESVLSSSLRLFGDRIKYKNLTLPDSTKTNIDDYITGPGSAYGLGFTSIKRYSFTEDLDRIKESLRHSRENAGKYLQLGQSDRRYPLLYVSPNQSSLIGRALGSNKRLSKGSDTQEIGSHPEVDEFENNAIAVALSKTLQYIDYNDVNDYVNNIKTLDIVNPLFGIYKTSRGGASNGLNDVNNAVGQYDDQIDLDGSIIYNNGYNEAVVISGSHWSKISREANFGSGRRDSINLTPMFSAAPGNAVSWESVTIDSNPYRIKDLVPFMIEAIDAEMPANKSIYMIFRAYITDLSDDVNADWTDIKYVGRGEKFYIYTGFTRKISISFKVAALSEGEMKPMYQKLNALMGNLMPDYVERDSGVMRGPLVRMTVGNYINSQPGKIDSLSYKVSNDSPWEINIDRGIDGGGASKLILPHIIEVSLNFTPIGSQTGTKNRLSNKESETNFVSHIAQNYNGTDEYQYITGSFEEGTETQ
jgi:hypothetical protein